MNYQIEPICCRYGFSGSRDQRDGRCLRIRLTILEYHRVRLKTPLTMQKKKPKRKSFYLALPQFRLQMETPGRSWKFEWRRPVAHCCVPASKSLPLPFVAPVVVVVAR